MLSKPPSYDSAMSVGNLQNITEVLASTSVNTDTVKFENCKISFAIDHSGSTLGSILEFEKSAIRSVSMLLSEAAHLAVRVLPWSSLARNPIRLYELYHLEAYAGTSPQSLLANRLCRQNLQSSDIWFLLTDGQISTRSVKQFAHNIAHHGLHGIACVIIIFGPASGNPATCDISVGVSVFAAVPDCLFLFFDTITQQLYMLQCSGRFTQILELRNEDQPILEESTVWSDLPKVDFSDLKCVSVRTPVKLSRDELLLPDGLLINLDHLWKGHLNDADTIDRIFKNDDNLKSIMLTAQTRDEVREFQNWLKPFLDDVSSPLKDDPEMGADTIKSVRQIVEEMQSGVSEERLKELQKDLRSSYAQELEPQATSSTYDRRRSSQAALERVSESGATRARALSSVMGDRPSRLSGHRHMPPPRTRGLKIPGFSKPESSRDMFTGHCSVCGGTDVNLVLLLRAPPAGSVTEGFPAPNSVTELTCPLVIGNFPETDIISSSICCDACSFYLAQAGRTPQNEELKCVLPLVTYAINQKAYIRQLKRALDNRFHENNLVQSFLAIVVNAFQRLPPKTSFDTNRSALKWLCKDLLNHYLCPVDVFASSRDSDDKSTRPVQMLSFAITSSFQSLYRSLTPSNTTDVSVEAEDLLNYPLLGFVVMVMALQHAKVSSAFPLGMQNVVWQRFLFQLIENHQGMEDPLEPGQEPSISHVFSKGLDMNRTQQQIISASTEASASDPDTDTGSATTAPSMDTLVTDGLLTVEELRDFRSLGEQFDWIEKRASPAIDMFVKSLVTVKDRELNSWEVFDSLRRKGELTKVFEEPLGVSVKAGADAASIVRAASPETV